MPSLRTTPSNKVLIAWFVLIQLLRQTPLPPLIGLIQLVDDLQTCLEVVRKIVEATEVSNPVKVAYAVKQVAREAAVGKPAL